MYAVTGLSDLVQTTHLSYSFFEQLDEFQVYFLEMVFKKSIEEKLGLLTEVEAYNYQLFLEFKSEFFFRKHGVTEEWWSKAS